MTMRRSKRRSHSAYGQDSCDACIRELRQTLKKHQSVADITCALGVQMATLRKLGEAVKKAEEATAQPLNVIMTRLRRLIQIARNPYRPELYYMRGPGPKWYAKHQNGPH